MQWCNYRMKAECWRLWLLVPESKGQPRVLNVYKKLPSLKGEHFKLICLFIYLRECNCVTLAALELYIDQAGLEFTQILLPLPLPPSAELKAPHPFKRSLFFCFVLLGGSQLDAVYFHG